MQRKEQLDPYRDFVVDIVSRWHPRDDMHRFEERLSRVALAATGTTPAPNHPMLHFLACFREIAVLLRDDISVRGDAARFLHDLGWTDDEITDGFARLARLGRPATGVESRIVEEAQKAA